jgi:hypothetical protein
VVQQSSIQLQKFDPGWLDPDLTVIMAAMIQVLDMEVLNQFIPISLERDIQKFNIPLITGLLAKQKRRNFLSLNHS